MEFMPSFLKRHITGKLGVTSRNVGCFLRSLKKFYQRPGLILSEHLSNFARA